MYTDLKKSFSSIKNINVMDTDNNCHTHVELGITRLHDELDGLIRLTVSLP